MEMLINPVTGDYTGESSDTLANAVYIRLMTPLGSWWADPSLGSKLHLLQREKDKSRVRLLARQYAEQALQPLLDDGRASSIVVQTESYQPGWLLLLVTVMSSTNISQTWKYPVKVS